MLTQQLQEQIEQEATHKGKTHMFIPMDGNYSSYEFHGFIAERSYLSAATKYASLYETAAARAERAEKALKEIRKWELTTGAKVKVNNLDILKDIMQTVNKALTPKTGEDE